MAATLSVNELMLEAIDSFKIALLDFSTMSTSFSSQTAVKGDVVTMNIRSLPTASTYSSGSGGYANGATAVHTLLDAFPVTIDQWPTVPVYLDTDSSITSKVDQLTGAARDAGFVLARSVLQTCLGKITAANFSRSVVAAHSNTTMETLEQAQEKLNLAGAGPDRYGIVNSYAATSLGADPRIASKDFIGQPNQGLARRHWVNVAGFRDIWEYPELPANSEGLSGFFGEKRAFGLCTRLPNHADHEGLVGIPSVHTLSTITDPDSGLSMMGVGWEVAGTLDQYFVTTILFGVTAGKNGGAADALTDKAGVRLTTS